MALNLDRDQSQRGHPTVARNVAAIAQLERDLVAQRPIGARIGAAIAHFVGTFKFVGLHAALIGFWMIWNRQSNPLAFDPAPYNTLFLLLATESILLSTFVLMSQNEMNRAADRRQHLELQISLLSESEMTKLLETVRQIGMQVGLPDAAEDDEEFREMAKETDVERIAQVVDEHLVTDGSKPKGN
jgi:uncharacterized membrane protein